MCRNTLTQVHIPYPSPRWRWPWRAPPWVAACSGGRRARGSGSGCGSSSKTRCSTPSQPVRWGSTESPRTSQPNSPSLGTASSQPSSALLSPPSNPSTHVSRALLLASAALTNDGILCALSLSVSVSASPWISMCLHAAMVWFMFEVFKVVRLMSLRIKWRRRVYLCRVSPSSWQRGRRERRAAASSTSTTRKLFTTPSGPTTNTPRAGQQRRFCLAHTLISTLCAFPSLCKQGEGWFRKIIISSANSTILILARVWIPGLNYCFTPPSFVCILFLHVHTCSLYFF